MMPKKCEVCKTDNPAEAKFCVACGRRFPEDVKAYDAFISYRRESGSDIATVIKVALEFQYKKRVFLDVRELQVGRFDESLLSQIEHTPNFILILSRGCLDRCAEKTDWLKREVLHALEHKRNIVPVLMEDFRYPSEDKLALLPDAMRDLPNLQAIAYSHVHQESAIGKIAEALSHAGEELVWKPVPVATAQPLPKPESLPVQDTPQPQGKDTTAPVAPPPPWMGEGGEPNLRFLLDQRLPRNAFLFGTDGIVTEVPLDQLRVRLSDRRPWSPRPDDLVPDLQLEDNVAIPMAEVAAIEVLSARADGPKRLKVTRNNGSLHEEDLRDKEACIYTHWGINSDFIPFEKLRRVGFGSLHRNSVRFDQCASWGKAGISGIAFSPDGTLLAAAARGGPLLFEVRDLNQLPFVDLNNCPHGSSSNMSISSDGSLLVSQEWGWADGKGWLTCLRMRHLTDGLLSREWRTGGNRASFSPTAPIVAASDDSSKGTVKLYAARDGSVIHALKAHTSDVTALLFSSDGRQLVSASEDGAAKVWNVDNGKCARKLLDSPNPLRAVAWPRDSGVFVGLTWDSLMVWSCGDWKRKLELRLPFAPVAGRTGRAAALACHPSRPWVAVADHQGIVIWNCETGLFDSIWEVGHQVVDVAFSRNGLLAAASQDGCLNLWRPV